MIINKGKEMRNYKLSLIGIKETILRTTKTGINVRISNLNDIIL